MTEIRFEPSIDDDKVSLNIYGVDQAVIDVKDLLNEFQRTEYRRYHLDPASLEKACEIFKKLQQAQRQSAESSEEIAALQIASPTVSVVIAERRAAHVELQLSADNMQCHLLIETSYGSSNPSAEDLAQFLADQGVIFGVRQNILQGLANRLENLPPGSRVQELIAEGSAAGVTRETELRYVVEPLEDRLMQPQLRDDGTVDMHDFGEIKLVQPGDILMERIPPQLGMPGTNVLGETLFASEPAERPLEPGEGTELSARNRNLLQATRRGVALRAGNGMQVSETYCVADVDLKTGNITFDGTVLVQGTVREGMSIKATGDVFVRDYVESATIDAGRNLVIGKGVLGRQTDPKDSGSERAVNSVRLHCGGDCHAHYAQYADIDLGGTLTIAKHLMHCHVSAQVIQVTSPKRTEGKILGGMLYPLQLLSCNTLGAPSYIHTEVDFSRRFIDELAELQKINEELGERVNVVRGMRAALRQFEVKTGSPDIEEQVSKINNTVLHFENLIQTLKQNRLQLMKSIVAIRETFRLDVHKSLYPGVSVRFVDKAFPIREEKGPCRIQAKDEGMAYFSLT